MLAHYVQLPCESYLWPLLCGTGFVKPELHYDTSREQELIRPRIAVIGTGISGIAAAAHISELGYVCCIFEAGGEDSIGGVWTKVNRSSGLQISSHFYHPHPSICWISEYPTQTEILQQIRELWLRFGLREKTRFNCPVHSLTRTGDKWIINGGSDGPFDGIIAAVGTCGRPRKCNILGQENFGGDVVHSAHLNNVDLRGKTVAVVGGGASAVEALEYAHDNGASRVKVLSRSDKWIIPRWRPLNFLLASSLSGPFTFWASLVGELLRFFFYGSGCEHVAPSRDAKQHLYSSTPIVNSRALELVRSGKAEWIKGICTHFEEKGINIQRRPNGKHGRRESRTLEECDVCIQATGFQRPTLQFLEQYQGQYQPPNWYMQVFPPGEPTICALNSTWQEAFGSVGGSQIGIFTRLLLVFLVEPKTQPSRSSMESWVEFMVKWNGGLQFITHIEIYLWLAIAIACNWRLWPFGTFIMMGGDMPACKKGRTAKT